MISTILFIGGGLEAVPAINLAKSMGLHVVVSDLDPIAPGMLVGDDQLVASTYNVSESLNVAKHYHQTLRKIDGVICVASDVPETVATIAKELNLPGIPVTSAILATDKMLMKERFQADGVPVPWFHSIDSETHLLDLIEEEDLPLVIKPVDSRGARGVFRLTSKDNVTSLYRKSLEYSPTNRVMVERFMFGPQVSTESIVADGVAHTVGFSDRNYSLLEKYAPSIIENGGQLPSFLSDELHAKVCDLINHAAASLGIHNGVVKGDIVITNGEPYIIELAARLSGGYFCTHEIPLNTGIDFVGIAIRQALGETISPTDLEPKCNQPVAQRYFFPAPGRVTRLSGAEMFYNHPDVKFLDIRVSVGDQVAPIDSHPGRAGMVITCGHTVEAAVSLAERVVDTIIIETQ